MLEFLQNDIAIPFWIMVERFTGMVFAEPVKRALEWVSLLGGGTAAMWGLLARMRGKKSTDARIDMLREEVAKFRAMYERALGPSAAPVVDDVSAGIELLIRLGQAKTLDDPTGAASEAALDEIIASRAKAREQIAREDAALYRQKGAFALLRDRDAAKQAYEKAVLLDPESERGWSGLLLAADSVGNVHLERLQYDDAERAFRRVHEAALRLNNPDYKAYATGNLARVEFGRLRLDKAEPLFLHMAQVAAEQGTKQLELGAMAYLEDIYRMTGDRPKELAVRKRKERLLAALHPERIANPGGQSWSPSNVSARISVEQ